MGVGERGKKRRRERRGGEGRGEEIEMRVTTGI